MHLYLTNVNVAALDAASPAAVASCYLTPTSENLYPCCSLRHLKIPARPAKHTRQTYIHEAFRILLYQTRYGVICFVPFPQPTHSPATSPTGAISLRQNEPLPHEVRVCQDATTRPQHFDARSDRSSLGTRREVAASRRRIFRQPLR
jgi:hypothetical protein